MENEVLPNAEIAAVNPTETAPIVTVAEPELNEDGTPKEVVEKPEKTEAERERARMQRGIDRKTRQAATARAEADFYKQELTKLQSGVNYQPQVDDSEPLSLTRSQVNEMVKAEAAKLAPTLQSEVAERQRREGIINSVSKSLGKEKFDIVASDLNEAFGGDDQVNGLIDRNGELKPAVEAIFESDNPAKVIEWLANPDNIEEAERIAGLSAIQAGRAIERLEAKLKTALPKVSNAPLPLDSVRSQGANTSSPDPANTKAWIKWANEQERKRA